MEIPKVFFDDLLRTVPQPATHDQNIRIIQQGQNFALAFPHSITLLTRPKSKKRILEKHVRAASEGRRYVSVTVRGKYLSLLGWREIE